jgi:hypothetical protein
MKHFIRISLIVLGAALFAPLGAPGARAAGAPLVVIAGASSTLTDISAANLRRAFLGEAVELAGKRLIPLNHPPGSPARVAFDRAVLGLSADQVGPFWVDRKIRDQSPPPRGVPSPELAVRVVASLPGAITYAASEQVAAGTRALTIDGKSPGQPGYLLP